MADPRPAWSGYQLTCPIRDHTLSTLVLITEARQQLDERLEEEGWAIAGPVQYDRRDGYLIVTTTVRNTLEPADARPWESRDALADELFDLYAA